MNGQRSPQSLRTSKPLNPDPRPYRGRLAPSPTGLLHLGHARTFWTACQRAREHGGILVFRNEDLDRARCRPDFVGAMAEDLRWFGLTWQEGPDLGGPVAPYRQSERTHHYRAAYDRLRAGGWIYPCSCSRRDILQALSAPHAADEEPLYPGTCRPPPPGGPARNPPPDLHPQPPRHTTPISWRFRVPDGETVAFVDGHFGYQQFSAGADFGDFVVWRHDDLPAYQLAVVVDDHEMQITEVVRGADLLLSTARQLLLYRALGWTPPAFFHSPLLTDDQGNRLAKRHDALSLRTLRGQGRHPAELRATWPITSP